MAYYRLKWSVGSHIQFLSGALEHRAVPFSVQVYNHTVLFAVLCKPQTAFVTLSLKHCRCSQCVHMCACLLVPPLVLVMQEGVALVR